MSQDYPHSIIAYVMTVSKTQQELQKMKEEILSNVQFNPSNIFAYIANQQKQISKQQFGGFIKKILKLDHSIGSNAYIQKYKLPNSIRLEHFLETLIPSNPAALRKSQMQFQDKTSIKKNIKSYLKVLGFEICNILALQQSRRNLCINHVMMEEYMHKDINKKGKIADRKTKEKFILFRNWLQLWIYLQEYNILHLARWLGGTNNEAFDKLFDGWNPRISKLKSTRSKRGSSVRSINSFMKSSPQKSINNNSQSLIRLKPKFLNNKKHKAQSQKHILSQSSQSKLRCTCYRQIDRSSEKNRNHVSEEYFSVYKKLEQNPSKLEEQQKIKEILDTWFYYIHQLLKTTSKKINPLKVMIKQQQRNQIIFDLFGTKQYKTQETIDIKILCGYIDKYSPLGSQQKSSLMEYFKNLKLSKIDCYKILSIDRRILNSQSSQHLYNCNQIGALIFQQYCKMYYILTKLAKRIQPYADLIFHKLDSKKNTYITKNDLEQFFRSNELEYRKSFYLKNKNRDNLEHFWDQENFNKLLLHFGDGKIITAVSFYRRIYLTCQMVWDFD